MDGPRSYVNSFAIYCRSLAEVVIGLPWGSSNEREPFRCKMGDPWWQLASHLGPQLREKPAPVPQTTRNQQVRHSYPYMYLLVLLHLHLHALVVPNCSCTKWVGECLSNTARVMGSSFCCTLLLQWKTSICFHKHLKPKESSRIKSRLQHLPWQPLFKIGVDSVTMISWAREILTSRPKEIFHVILPKINHRMKSTNVYSLIIQNYGKEYVFFSIFWAPCQISKYSAATGWQLQKHREYSSVHSQDGR